MSNVAFAKIVRDLSDLKRNALDLSLAYSAWPIVDLVQAAQEELGVLPRYVVGVSSDGAEVCHPGYDLAGASKAVLETLCRYLAVRLRAEGVRVNAVRPGLLDTAELARDARGRGDRRASGSGSRARCSTSPGVARACVALCSGLLDSMTGQVLVVDEGWSLVDPLGWTWPVPGRPGRRGDDRRPRRAPALLRGALRTPVAAPAGPPVLDRAGIEALLPHRGLALLLDTVLHLEADPPTIVAEYDLASASPVLAGHFPGRPVWPGLLQAEAIGQAGLLAARARAGGRDRGRAHGRAGRALRAADRAPRPRADRRARAGGRAVRGGGRPVHVRRPRLFRGRIARPGGRSAR